MSTSIGKLQVDVIANIEKFVAGVKGVMAWAEKMAKKVGDALRSVEQGLKQIGEKMTKFVTLPLVALATAAVRAADPLGEFGKELRTLAVEAQQALEPLGRVLIKMFREAEPTIRTGIGFIRALTEQFEQLDEPTKRSVVKWAAIAAAIGPVSIAAAGLVAVFNSLAPAAIAVGSATLSIVKASPMLFIYAAAAAEAALALFSLYQAGRYIYENSQLLQETLANAIYSVEEFGANVRLQIKLILSEVVGAMSKFPDGVLSFIGGLDPRLSGLATAATWIKAQGKEVSNSIQIWSEYSETVSAAAARNKASIDSIRDDFTKNPTRKTIAQLFTEDLDALKAAIKSAMPNMDGIGDKFDDLMKRAKEWAKQSEDNAKAVQAAFGSQVADRIKGFASSVGDAFADLALDGENNFKALAKSFEKMLISMFATKLLFQPLFDEIGSKTGGWIADWGSGSGGAGAGTAGSAGLPGAYDMGMSYRIGGTAGGTVVNVIDQRSGGSPVQVSERQTANGKTIDVLIKDSVKKLIRSGELDRDMRVAYGAGRSGAV